MTEQGREYTQKGVDDRLSRGTVTKKGMMTEQRDDVRAGEIIHIKGDNDRARGQRQSLISVPPVPPQRMPTSTDRTGL